MKKENRQKNDGNGNNKLRVEMCVCVCAKSRNFSTWTFLSGNDKMKKESRWELLCSRKLVDETIYSDKMKQWNYQNEWKI